MEKAHIPQIVEIENSTFKMPWTERAFRAELVLQVSRNFVALDPQGNVLGYLVTRLEDLAVHILNIAVRSDVRRCGIGSALMRKAFEVAKKTGAEILYLEVRASNLNAINLYRKFGFSALRRVENYYAPDGEAAIIMVASVP